MPHRDPETGKFVADAHAESFDGYHDTRGLRGGVTTMIPAADLSLSGGSTNVAGVAEATDETELIDFGALLGPNEVFEVVWAEFVHAASLPSTATAESQLEHMMWVGSEAVDQMISPAFYNQSALSDVSDTIIDGVAKSTLADELYTRNLLTATGDVADSTNGLGAGGGYKEARWSIPFKALYGVGPLHDQDDELWANQQFNVANVSDHAVEGGVWCTLRGIVHEA